MASLLISTSSKEDTEEKEAKPKLDSGLTYGASRWDDDDDDDDAMEDPRDDKQARREFYEAEAKRVFKG